VKNLELLKKATDSIIKGIRLLAESELYQKFLDWFEPLNPNQRTQFKIAAGGAGIILIGFLLIYPIWSTISSHLRVNTYEEALRTLRSAKSELTAIQRTTGQLLSRQTLSNRSLADEAFTGLAQSSQIPPDRYELGPVSSEEADGDLLKNQFTVKLQKINLKVLSELLKNISSSPYGLSVGQIDIRTNRDPEGWVDSDITLIQWQAQDSEGASS
jgi:hypothetical protein